MILVRSAGGAVIPWPQRGDCSTYARKVSEEKRLSLKSKPGLLAEGGFFVAATAWGMETGNRMFHADGEPHQEGRKITISAGRE